MDPSLHGKVGGCKVVCMNRGAMALIGLASGVPGCAPVPVPTPAMAAAGGVSFETLQQGHGVYLTQCGGCHELIAPDKVGSSDWRLVVPGMCWSAGLTRADEVLVLKYVLAAKKM